MKNPQLKLNGYKHELSFALVPHLDSKFNNKHNKTFEINSVHHNETTFADYCRCWTKSKNWR